MDTIGTIKTKPLGTSLSTVAGNRGITALVWRRLRSLRRIIKKRLELRRTRAQLYNLSDEQLLDVGLTRAQAKAEARKGFWR